MPKPTLSVVVPTYNRRERLHQVLAGLAEQTFVGAVEVVVVSDGSTDGTDEYLRGGGTPLPVVSATQENMGPAAARNRALQMATGELVVFIDDDVVPSRRLIQAHVDAHARLGASMVVIGPMLDPPDYQMSSWVRWEQAMLAKQYSAMTAGTYRPTARQFYTGNASVLRRHVLDAGGFDPQFRRAEDIELAYRLEDRGLRFAFEPDAIGFHYAERTFASWCSAASQYGRNDVRFARAGRPFILKFVAEEYHRRDLLVRALTRLCVSRPRLASAVVHSLRGLASVGEQLRSDTVPRHAMSGIHQLAYYRGVADELGGPAQLWALINGD